MQLLELGAYHAVQHTARRPRSSLEHPRSLIKHVLTLLYRFRLGGLLGHQLMLLVPEGQGAGGSPTVLRVWHYDRRLHECLIMVRDDDSMDWYRDVVARPSRVFWSGRRHEVPVQRLLSPNEVVECLLEQARTQPRRLASLLHSLGYPPGTSPEQLCRIGHELRGVAFRPHQILY
jgi:hypothetical protein